MIEVEVKARINSFKEMEERLENLGAAKTKTEFQEDIYFASPIVDFAETDEALRVRSTNNGIFITYKGPKLNDKAKTRKEVEMSIESAKKAPKSASGLCAPSEKTANTISMKTLRFHLTTLRAFHHIWK